MALSPSLLALLLLVLLMPWAPREAVGVEDGASAAMASGELSALFDVMSALLDDPTWAQLHPNPCTDTPWPGLQCELAGAGDPLLHVTRLHVGPDVAGDPPCRASASLPAGPLLRLPFLKSLSLFGCFLAGRRTASGPVLPPALFANFSSLEQLVVKSNPGLSGEIPMEIGGLRSLRVLSLSQNGLSGGIPKEIGGLGRLEQLDLSYNHFSGLIPNEVIGLSSLGILDLGWNGLQGQIPWSLGQLQSLQKIDLSHNKLSGKIPPTLGKLERLVLLDLSHNSLTGPMPETLSGLKELEYFLLADNPIRTTMPLFIGSLKKLGVVVLSGCGFSGPIPTYLASLSNLTALSLDRNRLNGSVPPGLGSLPSLGQLNLSQNQLTGEIAFTREFVSRLGRRLDVRDNKGLCKNPHVDLNLPLYAQAPPCLDSPDHKSTNGSWSEEEPGGGDPDGLRGRPGLDGGQKSLSSSLGSVSGSLIFLPAAWVLGFLWL